MTAPNDTRAPAAASGMHELAAISVILGEDTSGANGDDAAVFTLGDGAMGCISVDTAVDGVHLHEALSLRERGVRAAACALSDIAAMGGRATTVVSAISVPPGRMADVAEVTAGISDRCAAAGAELVGGDLITLPEGSHGWSISVTCIGVPGERGAFVMRSGARVGDVVVVTGTLGASRAGLLAGPTVPQLWARYVTPPDRLRAGQIIAAHASSMLDLSDGLASDAHTLGRASNVGLHIDLDELPIDDAVAATFAANGIDAPIGAATGGDDYELLFACAREDVGRIRRSLDDAGLTELSLTSVGICADTNTTFHHCGSIIADLAGFEHG